MPASPRLRRTVLALSLAAWLGACATWSQRPLPAPGHDRFLPGPVRVTRSDGIPFLLDDVTVGADSVVGREVVAPRRRVSIPVSEVRSVEARRTDPLATAAVVAISVAAAAAAWAALVIAIVGTGN